MSETIEIKGAKTHNLKNIDVSIPKNKLTVITGVSGSGKSSLAFDTLYEEGKRRYLMFSGTSFMVDSVETFKSIKGLSPTVAVKQSIIRQSNPRSSVGTRTKISNMLAVLRLWANKIRWIIIQITNGAFTTSGRLPKMLMDAGLMEQGTCPKCKGTGLGEQATNTTINGKTISELEDMYISDLYAFLQSVEELQSIPLVSEILIKLDCMIETGLKHLALS